MEVPLSGQSRRDDSLVGHEDVVDDSAVSPGDSVGFVVGHSHAFHDDGPVVVLPRAAFAAVCGVSHVQRRAHHERSRHLNANLCIIITKVITIAQNPS